MRLDIALTAFLGCLALLACGGGSGGDDPSGLPTACPEGPFLTVSPLDIASISSVAPLGNLNPPGHVFPTDHMGFYLTSPGGGAAPYLTPVYAPGDLTVAMATALENLTAGYTDYGLVLMPCRDITIEFAHVTSLAPEIFDGADTLDEWERLEEYTTGGQTFRRWRREYGIQVAAGTRLGTAGGRAGQWALDVGAHDQRVFISPVANASRWTNSWYRQTVCPLDYFEPGPVRDALMGLLSRAALPGDPWPCGRVLQDLPGTAQGTWFVEGTTSTYPEDPHLALVWSDNDPLECVLSVGTSIAGFGASDRYFAPLGSGRRNRAFTAVTPDGLIYGYQLPSPPGVLIVNMPDAVTLWTEYLPSATSDPATWTFSGGRTVFVR